MPWHSLTELLAWLEAVILVQFLLNCCFFMVTCCAACGSNERLFGVTLGVSVLVSTRHNKALTSAQVVKSLSGKHAAEGRERLTDKQQSFSPSCCMFLFCSSGYSVFCQSLYLSICFSLSLFLSHFFPLTINLRSWAANNSPRPSKWHLNVKAASDVPKPPQCTMSLTHHFLCGLCHGLGVVIFWCTYVCFWFLLQQ